MMAIPSKRLQFYPDVLEPGLRVKWDRLISLIKDLQRVVVAYSGGVDSATLAAAAYTALGENMLAITIQSPVESAEDTQIARQVAELIGFPHLVIEHDDLEDPNFVANTPERCYFCKFVRFGVIQKAAAERGFTHLLEGTNADDTTDYRPGMRAVKERQGGSPLMEANLTKTEIRTIAKAMGLPVWDRPSSPCLASRFPYGSAITVDGLRKIAAGEIYLKGLGFTPVRVRYHGTLARLEVSTSALAQAIAQREDILKAFKEIGFTYVALDLAGFRSGSLNEVLPQIQSA